MIGVFLYVLFLHWLADFVCQTRWMAENKSKNNKALSTHVAIYSLVHLVGLSILPCYTQISLWNVLVFVAINAPVHWGVDYVTSRINAHFWKTGQNAYFWWNIGFDQFVHQTCLLLSAVWLLS